VIPADVFLHALRERCEGSFEYFARYFFKVRTGSPFVWSEHHELITEALMAVHRGEHTNQRVHIPPRYSKTELCVVLFVAWCYVKNPRCRFIHLSYADQLVQDNSQAVKDVMTSREFRQLWPHLQIRDNKDSKKAWDTVQGGTFYATSAGGQVTGFGAGRLDEIGPDGAYTFSGCLLIDDPLKPDDARHDTVREAINNRWEGTIKSRRNSPRTPTLLIMQRIHEKDFAAHVAADSSESWHSLELPALLNEGTPDERALWPAKHSVEKLRAMRDQRNDRGEVNPQARQTFDAQYQQRPTPAGGGTFRESWWRYYGDMAAARARCTVFWITADTAFTADPANDATSLQLWGAEGRKRLYLLDRLHGRWEFPELQRNALEFWRRHPYAKRFYIEAKASGLSLIQSINRARTPEMARGKMRAVPWKPKDWGFPEDKTGRAQLAAVQVFKGNVWLPDPDQWPWVWEFVDEHSAFTLDDSHAHDDDVDGETMAVSIWTHQGGGRDR
jgi:predicted phage terminase large subunit-like protein